MNDLGAALLADVPPRRWATRRTCSTGSSEPGTAFYTHLAEDGSVTEEYDGRVTFGWLIDGWAMQDVWSGGGSVGTSIRWFDPKEGVWIVMWFAPEGAVVTRVEVERSATGSCCTARAKTARCASGPSTRSNRTRSSGGANVRQTKAPPGALKPSTR
jgi:hypothetical protein